MRNPLRDSVCRAAILAVACFNATVVHAAFTMADIEPVIGRTAWERLLRTLPFDDDQRLIVDMLYRDYASGLDDLVSTTVEREHAAGGERVREALYGRASVDADELRRLRGEVAETHRAVFPEARMLMDELLAGLEALAPAETTPRVQELRRRAYLAPSQAAADRQHEAGARLDVGQLLERASEEAGELAGGVPASARAILADYHIRLDAALPAWCAADWNDAIDRQLARISGDAQLVRVVERRQLDRWKERYTLHHEAVAAIAQVIAEEDSAASVLWTERFQRACFPAVFKESRVERAQAWMHRELGPADISRADATVLAYHEALRPLQQEAVALLLRARLEAGVIVHSRSNPTELEGRLAREIFEALLRNSGRRASLETEAISAMRQGLDDKQARRLDAASR